MTTKPVSMYLLNNSRDNDTTTPGIPDHVPIPIFDNPFNAEILPTMQSKSPLVQPKVISSDSVTVYVGEETNIHVATASF